MNKRPTAVKALGEIAIRVNDLDKMQKFYEEIIGLVVFKRFSTAVFFHISDGYKGHPQALVLFDRREGPAGPQIHKSTPEGVSQNRSTLDHIAFEIDLEEFEHEHKRLIQLGLTVETRLFDWVGWRSLYISDPEKNTVEFVCYDSSVKKVESDAKET
jgi:catechol 2,3-dioxygenase-like lactoylglutathione lyase family enzyme